MKYGPGAESWNAFIFESFAGPADEGAALYLEGMPDDPENSPCVDPVGKPPRASRR